jgi:hypothetical protein
MRIAMCDKCREIDERIARQRRLASQSDDAKLAEQTDKLIRELIAEKVALHTQPAE